MRAELEKVRQLRDQMARERMLARHVEFCSRCGRACDRTGRKDSTLCIKCQKGGSS